MGRFGFVKVDTLAVLKDEGTVCDLLLLNPAFGYHVAL